MKKMEKKVLDSYAILFSILHMRANIIAIERIRNTFLFWAYGPLNVLDVLDDAFDAMHA